ncbi:GIY-YIG nuclease family protein [Pararhodobacter oceanensis]|uniref:GIY-YIG nuclease family protein n=1 Tax=Pararhodobacter oceanensis TaxID=2172121 RepID=UPI003A959BAB
MPETRRAMSAAYKTRKSDAWIYALRMGDALWVGSTPTLASIENRHGFTLRQGTHPNKALQQAWLAAGERFTFETLEHLDPDLSDLARARLLKERLAYWQEELDAPKV